MAATHLSPREQGDLGELSAMEWLARQGAHVFIPVGHSPDVDLVADFGERLLKVEVKTSRHQPRPDRWQVLISTLGGNQSWTGRIKYFDPSRCDYLFVAVADGRRWFIPTPALECRSAITLGGPKYSEYEVDPGPPFARPPSLESDPALGEYPSGQRMAAVNRPAKPSQVRILPPPPTARPTYERRLGRIGHARIWPKRRITLPLRAFDDAGLRVGDRLHATADGPGRVILERIAGAWNRLAADDGSEPKL